MTSRFSLVELVKTNHGTLRGAVRCLLAQTEATVGRLDPWMRESTQDVERLVFVCLGNINRSAFGAALARSMGAHAVSLGLSTTTGAEATPQAVATASRHGIDLMAHRATNLSDYEHRPGDLMLVMEVRHARRLRARGVPDTAIALLGQWARPLRLHLHDPHTLSNAYFATCFELIASATRELCASGRTQQSPFMNGDAL